MIKLSHGDLLEAKEDIIVHQVNCQGKMNSGIAKQIREKWPQAYKDYMDFCNQWKATDMLGQVTFSFVEPGKFVAHVFGQKYYGYDGQRYTSYDGLYEGLSKLKVLAKQHNMSVALPYNIGCDRGGADWFIVESMIQSIFADYEVHIYKLEGK